MKLLLGKILMIFSGFHMKFKYIQVKRQFKEKLSSPKFDSP